MSDDRRIPLSSKLSFGLGQAAEGIQNYGLALFLVFYYNQVLGLPGALCGLAVFIALLFDAVTDPLTGSISDTWRSRFGRRHPFMYASALPVGLAFYGLFSPPALSQTGLFWWLLTFAVLTRGAMTLYHVPHLALGAELSKSFEERTSIVAYRQAFSFVGSLILVVTAFGYFFADGRGGRLNAAAYAPFALMCAALMGLTIFASAQGTLKEVPYLPRPKPTAEPRALHRLFADMASALRNASFRWLFSGVLIVFMMVGIDTALNLYMFEFFWELDSRQILLLTVTTIVGSIAGAFATRAIHSRWDKKPALVLGTAGWAFFQTLPVILRLLDVFPDNGTTEAFALLLIFRFAQGAIVQQANISFGAMMADVADEHELESGRRQEGIFFGAISFSAKATTGLGSFIAGVGLDVIGWPSGGQGIATQISADVLTRLGILYGPFVCGFAVLSVWCYGHYRIDRARHGIILSELAKRAGGAQPKSPAFAATPEPAKSAATAAT